jgi:two-component system, NtrC family, nitrogen regulation sensor histidine kinase NtrY
MLGKTERRLALVILVTAVLPLAAAVLLASSMLDYASSVWLRPDVDQQLERGIDLYKDYVRIVKEDMKHQTDAMVGDEALRDAARRNDAAATRGALGRIFARSPQLVSLAVEEGLHPFEGDDGMVTARQDRTRPFDEMTERRLPVRRSLGTDGAGPTLVATFAFDRRYEQGLEQAGQVRETYTQLEKERAKVYAPAYEAFAALLGITVVATFVLGFFAARGITRRINRLAIAINEVAAGDFDVRVPVTGSDELTELARVFNRMLAEMQQSRARIEYLQRIGAWQEMAQRLAHEIKNPLTPIQLAVQECHRKYAGGDARFRLLLDTTLEIVEEEVGTLRRLVGNFSSFARLPHAELAPASLRDFLKECSEQLGYVGAELTEDGTDDLLLAHDVEVRWEVPPEDMPVAIDRQMLRRVLVNLVRNAVEAIRDARPARDGEPRGRVVVRADPREDAVDVMVEDDGPGVPEGARDRIFDPYFTTKAAGTGLGLAIVKKIVVEHNGTIAARPSERLGGAAFVISLPLPHSLAIAAASGREPAEAPAPTAPAP